MEAFSDGVIAIIITIMVLEMKVPHETAWAALYEVWPVFISYFFSFLMLAIYWGNHHHLVHTISEVTSSIMWANLHLLFWLSLVPFATAWMGENHFEANTMALYALLLAICGIAYYILLLTIRNKNMGNEKLHLVLTKQSRKGMLSFILYLAAIPLTYLNVIISASLMFFVAIIWLIPDRNIEKKLG